MFPSGFNQLFLKKKKKEKRAWVRGITVAAYLRLEPRLGPGTELMPELGAAIWSDPPSRFSGFVCSYRVCSCAATLKMFLFLFFFFPFFKVRGCGGLDHDLFCDII